MSDDLAMEREVKELLAENKARLRDGRTFYLLENAVLVRVWVDFPREYLDAGKRFLLRYGSADNWTQDRTPAQVVRNPLVDGRPQEGDYRPLRVDIQRGEVEGVDGVHLIQVLALGDIQQDYVVKDKDCRFRVSWKWIFSAATIPALPTNTVGVKYEYAYINRSYEFGGWDVVLERRERLVQQVTFTRRASAAGVVTERQTLGKRTGPAELSPVAGKILTQEYSPNDDCSGDERINEDQPTDQTAISREESPSRSVTEELHTQAEAPLDAPVQETGKIISHDNAPTEAGKTRTVKRTVQPKNQTRVTREESPSRSVVSTLNTEAAAPLGAPVSETGKVKRNTNVPTDAGNTRTEETVEQPKDQVRVTVDAAPKRTVTETLHTEAAAPLAAPAAQAGRIRQNTNVPTEAGNTRTNEREDVATAWGPAAHTSKRTEMVVETTTEAGNQATVPVAAVGEEVRARLNDYLLYDYIRVAAAANAEFGTKTFTVYSRPFQAKVGELVQPTDRYTAYPNNAAAAKAIKLGLADTLSASDFDVVSEEIVVPVYGWVRWKEVHTLKLHATLAAALTEIDGASDGSTYREIQPGVYMTDKITVTQETTSAPYAA